MGNYGIIGNHTRVVGIYNMKKEIREELKRGFDYTRTCRRSLQVCFLGTVYKYNDNCMIGSFCSRNDRRKYQQIIVNRLKHKVFCANIKKEYCVRKLKGRVEK